MMNARSTTSLLMILMLIFGVAISVPYPSRVGTSRSLQRLPVFPLPPPKKMRLLRMRRFKIESSNPLDVLHHGPTDGYRPASLVYFFQSHLLIFQFPKISPYCVSDR
ncbi:hypothetical protein B0T21DRAFT_194242 [Apiosordaria backusii]|uniref:Uncharacterized protein n=1 Tax=Apiosordaria backusii TaxID=314023 RepID=A0AA40BKJ7_9PEZI|nr:hypothetical protein B0T21DRAFT_194242 [Apiosordaria backusii]